MKYIILMFALLFSTSTFADEHWIEVAKPTTAVGTYIIYLDDSNVIDEDGYNGFRVRIVLSEKDEYVFRELVIFEYNCHTHVGRAQSLQTIFGPDRIEELSHHRYREGGDMRSSTAIERNGHWTSIEGSPSTDALEAVKQRVCFKAY